MQPRSTVQEAQAAGDLPAYSFKPSLIGALHSYRLADDALEWEVGRRSGRVPYRAVRRLRLSFRPMTMASRRFLAEIWSPNTPKLQIASTSWRSIVEIERQDAAYTAFVEALHRRLRASGSIAVLETGSPVWLYWPGVVMFVILLLALAVLAVRALQAGSTVGAIFVVAFIALSLWQVGDFFRRNRPGVYSADAIPPQVLPG
jgi:hypothetical protein